ncbi:hypothetical protein NEAUS07_2636 [Nematocida ausubeli]|nr:hypothetical protein NEAUS07_2636 [Nematocida ausubeli]
MKQDKRVGTELSTHTVKSSDKRTELNPHAPYILDNHTNSNGVTELIMQEEKVVDNNTELSTHGVKSNDKITKRIFLFLLLVGGLNLLVSAPLHVTEIFNDRMQVGKYILKNFQGCSELSLKERIDCINNQKTTVFPNRVIQKFLSSNFINEPTNSTVFQDLLRNINFGGFVCFLIGKLVGYIMFLFYDKYFPNKEKQQSKFITLFFIIFTIPGLILHSIIINGIFPELFTKNVISLGIFTQRFFLGINNSLILTYIDLKGRTLSTQKNLFSSVKILTGSLSFVFPAIFSEIYYQIQPDLAMVIISLIILLPCVLIPALEHMTNYSRNSEYVTNYNGEEEVMIEMTELNTHVPYIPDNKTNSNTNTRLSTHIVKSNDTISQKNTNNGTLTEFLQKIRHSLEWFGVLPLLYPLAFYMTGVNAFLYYKEISILSSSSSLSLILLLSPLLGGILGLFFTKSAISPVRVSFGFLAVGILQIIFYFLKFFEFNQIIIVVLVGFMIVNLTVCLNPLLSVIPVLYEKSVRFVVIFGFYQQIIDIFSFSLVSLLFTQSGISFVWVTGIFSIVSGTLIHYVL